MKAEPTYYSSLVLYPEHIVLRMCKMIPYSTHTENYSVITLRCWTPVAHSQHTLLFHILTVYSFYHLHHGTFTIVVTVEALATLFFQSASLLWLPSFPCSVRIRCSVMSATLLCPLTASLLLLLSFLLVLIFSLSFQSHFFFSPCCPQDPNLLCFSLCRLLVSLHMASTTTQILMGLSCVSSAQTSPPQTSDLHPTAYLIPTSS